MCVDGWAHWCSVEMDNYSTLGAGGSMISYIANNESLNWNAHLSCTVAMNTASLSH
jgi:hypothetical protein